MHLLWLLLGCAPQDGDPADNPVCSPAEGEVFWLEGQSTFTSIDDALSATDAWSTLCLGEGLFPLEGDLLDGDGWTGQVHLIGRSPEQTSLIVPESPDRAVLVTGVPEQLVLESLSLESPLGISAQELVFDNVKMDGVVSQDSLLQLTAERIRLAGLHVVESEFVYGGLLLGNTSGDQAARLLDLQWEGNRAQRGTHVVNQAERPLTLEGCSITDSYDASTSLGYPMIQASGTVRLAECTFASDRSSASVVSAAELELVDVEIRDSRCATGGLLQAVGSMDLEQVSIQDSRSANAMLLLYSDINAQNQATLTQVDMGTQEENSGTCDFMVDGICVRDALGWVESWSCTDCRNAAEE